MSQVLDRLGRFAARRPLVVIGAWLVVAVLVVASAASFGKHLEDPFEAPGLDSQRATELLSRAGAAEAGLTADVVLSPASDAGTLSDAAAEADLRQVRTALEDLPQVERTTQTVSPDGRVALVRVQYPVLEDLSAADLDRLKTAMDEARSSTSLRVEGGGDLFFTFEEPPAGLAEGLGLVAAMVILLVAFGSVVAMGLPIVTALLGLAVGVGSLTLVAYVVDVPGWAPVLGSMVGLGVGIDYALFISPGTASSSPKAGASRTPSREPWPVRAARWWLPEALSWLRSSGWRSRGSRSSPQAASPSRWWCWSWSSPRSPCCRLSSDWPGTG